jgi:site-specific DNA recombinase
MPKAIIYCRVSSKKQVEEGHGLDSQESNCRSYAEGKEYKVAKVFRDEGVSGGTIDRPGIDAMLEYLETKASKDNQYVVIVDDLKRLARDVVGHIQLRKLIKSGNGILESPSHTFEESPEGAFIETLLAATGQLEREQNKRQVKRRMKARLEAGYWPFYAPPGYKNVELESKQKRIIPSEPEASIIREALEGFAIGKFHTIMDVTNFLHLKGFNHWKKGKRAYPEQAKRLLQREAYAGYISYPKWEVTRRKGHHQPLVSPETFDKVQERLEERVHAPARQDLNKDFPLRGFVLCSECNNPYTASWSKGRNKTFAYYRCTSKGCSCKNKSVRADKMHEEFEKMLKKLKPREGILAVVKAELSHQWNKRLLDVNVVRQERQDKLDAVQKEIDEYMESIKLCSNPTVIKGIEEKIDSLEAKRLRLGEKVERPKKHYNFDDALDQVFEFLKDPHFVWKTGDLNERRLVLRLVFDEPLIYNRESGFGTAKFSLPVNVSCVTELDEIEVVEMPGIEPGSNV